MCEDESALLKKKQICISDLPNIVNILQTNIIILARNWFNLYLKSKSLERWEFTKKVQFKSRNKPVHDFVEFWLQYFNNNLRYQFF